jgi:hypothetical protein
MKRYAPVLSVLGLVIMAADVVAPGRRVTLRPRGMGHVYTG